MKRGLRKVLLCFMTGTIIFAGGLYAAFLFAVPKLAQSNYIKNKIELAIYERTNIRINLYNTVIKTHPNLSVELDADKISGTYKDETDNIFVLDNIFCKFSLIKSMPETLNINYIFADIPKLSKIKIKKSNKKSKLKFNAENLAPVNIKKADIVLLRDNSTNADLTLKTLKIKPDKNDYTIIINGILTSNKLDAPVTIGANGNLKYKNNSLIAENYYVNTGIGDFILNGKLTNKYDFNVKAQKLYVKTLEEAFLIFMKKINPNEKNFIENFYDFNGLANLDINIKQNSIEGKSIINKLSAKTVKFSIPIMLPNVEFIFNKDLITADATGAFGMEPVHMDFRAENIFNKDRIVSGTVKSKPGSNFAKTYIPDTDIKNHIDLMVKYFIQHQKPNVEYFAKIPIESNIYYRNFNLGMTDKERRVYAKTEKIKDNMYLRTYDYSYLIGNNTVNIVSGDGLFIRENGKFRLEYISGKTNGEAPISVAGSFDRYVRGGTFSGNLSYNYPNNLLTGNFILHDSNYKAFHVSEASVNADENTMKISANGTFHNAKFTGNIDMLNHFDEKITVNNINLYLAEYTFSRKSKAPPPKLKLRIPPPRRNIDWVVKNGTIKLDKLKVRNIIIENLNLVGNLENHIVHFNMQDVDFAKGKLGARGQYNIANKSADAYFTATDVDSNSAASMMFNLNNQIEGVAHAYAHVIANNKFNEIHAHSNFSIEKGALTKIGSREFIIKKSKDGKRALKITLPKIINFKEKEFNSFKSNIKGSFDINNDILENVEIYSPHEYFATFTEGRYNILTQDAEILVWGKYNKSAQKGIKILFVPLSMITKIILRPQKTKNLYADKINKIPTINATEDQLEIFKVQITGNPNDNSKIKVEMNRLK